MKSWNVFIFTLFFLLFNSCSNKLELIGEYEENAVVYGLLDPSQPIQFIKINKVFTNPDASAADIAKIADSLFFDSIAPTLLEVETGRIIPLYKSNILLKDIGYFASSPNYLYSTKETIYANNPNNKSEYYHYQLDIYLPAKKKHIWSVTDIPDSTILLTPNSIAFQTNREISFPLTGKVGVSFQAPSNSKVFDAYLYFNYLEINKQDTNIKVNKTIKFRLINNYEVIEYNAHEGVLETINGDAFYDFLLGGIRVDTSITRRFMPCKLELTDANLIFDNFLQASTPFIGIVQRQKDLTNVINGFGVFASRRISRYNNISISASTKNAIISYHPYKTLGFVN